jgi:hypothetical protein
MKFATFPADADCIGPGYGLLPFEGAKSRCERDQDVCAPFLLTLLTTIDRSLQARGPKKEHVYAFILV